MINEYDPISWLLDRGKALERACDFATAIKYYFAGRMFFARLQECPALYKFYTFDCEPTARPMLRKRKKLEEEFKKHYADLLPMTNAEVLHFPRFFTIPTLIFLVSNVYLCIPGVR